jgi:hypothetical protein
MLGESGIRVRTLIYEFVKGCRISWLIDILVMSCGARCQDNQSQLHEFILECRTIM